MRYIRELWSRHFLLFEALLALASAIVFWAWYFHYDGQKYSNELLLGNRAAIYGASASLFGSLLGFSITATSIALTMSEGSRLSILKNSSHYPTLWRIFSSTIRTLGYATVMSFMMLLFDKDASPSTVLVPVFVFFVLLAIFRICRTIWAFEKLISLMTRP